jgi:glycosyltransferase involved in cell wall biosynthesis
MLNIILPLVRNRRDYDIILVAAPRILGLPVVLLAKALGKNCVLKPDSCGEMDGSYVLGQQDTGGLVRWLAVGYFRFRNRILANADAFVAISEVIVGEIRGLGIDAGRIRKIPNGVETGKYVPVTAARKGILRNRQGLSDTAVVFIYCGRLTREKGLLSLLRVWKQLSGRFGDVHLLLVGSGAGMALSCEEDLRVYVEKNDLEKVVTFTGAVDDVMDYLHCADVFILPSLTEAFGLALIEAQACGLPAIGTRVGGIPDIISHGSNGLLVEQDNDAELLEAATRMVTDRNMRTGYGQEARRQAVEKFSIGSVADMYLEFMSSIVSRKPA